MASPSTTLALAPTVVDGRAVRRALGLVLGVVLWVFVVSGTLLVLAAVVVPRVTGSTPYTVLTGSMTPIYPPGTLVVVKPADASSIAVGDVITYQLHSGEPTVVTHRVESIGWGMDREKLFTTKGDANEAPDPAPVRAVQVRGKVWYALPWVGRLNVLLQPQDHQLVVRLAAGSLFAYAAALLVGDRLRPRRPRRPRPGRHAPRPAPRHAARPAASTLDGPLGAT